MELATSMAVLSTYCYTYMLSASSLFVILLLPFLLQSRRRNPYPPGPKGWPVIGNLIIMNKFTHRGLAQLAKKYAGIIYLNMVGINTVVVSSTEVAKEVLHDKDNIFCNRPTTVAISYLTYGRADMAFADYGPFWRQMRKLCVMKLFSKKRVKTWESIRSEVEAMVETVKENFGSPVSIGNLVFTLTKNIIYRAAFGSRSRAGQAKFIAILQEFSKLFGAVDIIDFFPCIEWADPCGLKLRLENARTSLDDFIDVIIDEHLDRKKSGLISEEDMDMVDDLLSFGGDDKSDLHSIKLTRDNIKAIIMDVMFGGVETVASAIEWVMAELLKNPKEMKKVMQGVGMVVGWEREVVESDLEKLTYLRCCVKETLRLHPPIPLLQHHTSAQSIVSGYFIPKNTRVIVNVWAIGREEKPWAEAGKFKPRRFMENGILESKLKGTSFEFIPFGYGRRSCPGTQLGMYAVELCVARLLHRFSWELPNGMKPYQLDVEDICGLTAPRKNRLVAVPFPTCASFPLNNTNGR